jgi:hypothetical protein
MTPEIGDGRQVNGTLNRPHWPVTPIKPTSATAVTSLTVLETGIPRSTVRLVRLVGLACSIRPHCEATGSSQRRARRPDPPSAYLRPERTSRESNQGEGSRPDQATAPAVLPAARARYTDTRLLPEHRALNGDLQPKPPPGPLARPPSGTYNCDIQHEICEKGGTT